jgi:hypothetical protein
MLTASCQDQATPARGRECRKHSLIRCGDARGFELRYVGCVLASIVIVGVGGGGGLSIVVCGANVDGGLRPLADCSCTYGAGKNAFALRNAASHCAACWLTNARTACSTESSRSLLTQPQAVRSAARRQRTAMEERRPRAAPRPMAAWAGAFPVRHADRARRQRLAWTRGRDERPTREVGRYAQAIAQAFGPTFVRRFSHREPRLRLTHPTDAETESRGVVERSSGGAAARAAGGQPSRVRVQLGARGASPGWM